MDGNRTHPGRLNSAPQTVLKTALLTSTKVRQRPPKIKADDPTSAGVRQRPPRFKKLAVSLAVRIDEGLLLPHRSCGVHRSSHGLPHPTELEQRRGHMERQVVPHHR